MSDFPISPGAPPYPMLNEQILEAAAAGSRNPALDGQRSADAVRLARRHHDELLVSLAESAERGAARGERAAAGAAGRSARAVGAARARSARAAMLAAAQISVNRAASAADARRAEITETWERRFAEAQASEKSPWDYAREEYAADPGRFQAVTSGGAAAGGGGAPPPGMAPRAAAERLWGENPQGALASYVAAALTPREGPGPWPRSLLDRIAADLMPNGEPVWLGLGVALYARDRGHAALLEDYQQRYTTETEAMSRFMDDWDVNRRAGDASLASLREWYSAADPVLQSAFADLAR